MLRLCEAMFNLGGNLITVFSKPFLLLVKHDNGSLDEFVRGLVGAALDIPLDESLQLGL